MLRAVDHRTSCWLTLKAHEKTGLILQIRLRIATCYIGVRSLHELKIATYTGNGWGCHKEW